MSPEDAETLFWNTMRQLHKDWPANQPEVGKTQRLKAWEAVLTQIRKEDETEMERLRQENRDLKSLIMDTVSADAA